MSFAVGSLVRARGREWVVLPESTDDLAVVRPLGGSEDEVAGIYLPLETVEPASFALPDPAQLGDHRSCRLLRDALRLGFRSSAGPFRSFARLAVPSFVAAIGQELQRRTERRLGSTDGESNRLHDKGHSAASPLVFAHREELVERHN